MIGWAVVLTEGGKATSACDTHQALTRILTNVTGVPMDGLLEWSYIYLGGSASKDYKRPDGSIVTATLLPLLK